jgi:rubrerythrin
MSGRLHITDGDVDTSVIAEYERSRRELVQRGIAAGGAVVAASAIPFFLRVRNTFAMSTGDAAVLEAAVGLEQQAVFAYTAAAASGKLGKSEPVARLFAEQEQEHADGLTRALRNLGGSPPPKPEAPGDVPGLADAARGNAADITNFAVELETMAVAAYYDAHGKLKAPELLATGASIMANEAQHLVVLRQALGKNPSPDAFVTGA